MISAFFSDWFQSNLILSFFSLITYFFGHLFFSIFSNDSISKTRNFFSKMALGLLGIVIMYALYKSSFLTIYTGILLSLAYYHLTKNKKIEGNFHQKIKGFENSLFLYFFISLFILTFIFTYLYHYDNRLFNHQDLAFYARIGNSLFLNGIETSSAEPFYIGSPKASIYHFFNEWMISFFLHFTNFTSLKTLLLLVIPVQTAIIILGAYSLCDQHLKKTTNLQKLLISFTFILLPGILSLGKSILLAHSLEMPYSVFLGGIVDLKIKIIYILFLLFFAYLPYASKQKLYLILSLIPLFWNTLIPGFLGGYILLLLYKLYHKDKLVVQNFIQLLLPIFYIPVYLLFVNFVFKENYPGLPAIESFGLSNYIIVTYSNIENIIETIVFYGIPIASLFVVLFLWYDKIYSHLENKELLMNESIKEYLLLIALIILASIFAFGIIRELFNARQILMNLYYPLINITIFLLLLWLFVKRRRVINLTLLILFSFLSVHFVVYSKSNIDSLIDKGNKFGEVNKSEPFLIASDFKNSGGPFSLYSKPFASLLMINENYKPIRLDIVRETSNMNAKDKLEYYGSVSNQLFFKYANSKSKTVASETKINFLKEYKIDYLLVDKETFNQAESYIKKLSIEKVMPFDDNILLLRLKV